MRQQGKLSSIKRKNKELHISINSALTSLLLQAAANESEALSDVSALRAALRPPLPLDGELRGRAEPPLVPRVPAGAAAGASVGAARRPVSHVVTR